MVGKALIIGINDYPTYKLAGCLNDCQTIIDTILKPAGVAEDRIRRLADADATKANIIDSLSWLCDAESSFCFYAGHGSLDADYRHPILVPHDCDLWWADPLTDHLIDSHVRDLKGVMIYDCCHSGSLHSADLDGSTVQANAAPLFRERFMPNPLWKTDATPKNDFMSRCVDRSTLHNHTSDYHPQENPFVYISGCRDIETSKEANFSDRPGGLFTTELCRFYSADPTIPLEALWKQTRDAVSSIAGNQLYSPQTPQLWCHPARRGQPLISL